MLYYVLLRDRALVLILKMIARMDPQRGNKKKEERGKEEKEKMKETEYREYICI